VRDVGIWFRPSTHKMDSSPPTPLAVQEAAPAPGDLRLHQFPSRIFRNQRMLRVWLPPGYDAPANQYRRYPVFYLNDGQNLFDTGTSFTGVEWQVGATAARLLDARVIPPMIFVGIDNAQRERIREYLPYRSADPLVLRPHGELYPQFLLREVMRFVNDRYRIAQGASQTGLGGSSLGALISLYTAMVRPGVFGHLLLESPSLWVVNRRILREARAVREWPRRIFAAIGTREAGREDKDARAVDDVLQLERLLRRAGLDDSRLRVEVDPGATHSERSWAKRFPEALRFLFGSEEEEFGSRASGARGPSRSAT
jgi:enterochelin esterase-like enzyme